ncbi:MAG TPA: zf-HC2 domain-containing protein [Pyrinomonadaceae bacterium]|nr:zf-HC2 domain-containing protein [Pyrinomonadaceae bacterium]
MNCDQCQILLEEYLDGELDVRVVELVDLHLSTCLACEAELKRLRVEFEQVAGVRVDLDPTVALWPGVAARIEAESKPGHSQSWWSILFAVPRLSVPAAVALVVLAVLTTVVFMKRLNPRHSGSPAVANVNTPGVPTHASEPAVVPAIDQKSTRRDKPRQKTTAYTARNRPLLESSTPDQLVREAQQKYLAAIQLLSRDVARNRSRLDPGTRQRLEESLTSIDRTIAVTRRAVRKSPDDPVAVQFMLAAYAKKVDVLREMANGGSF